jgi:hypothetical protein
MSNMQAYESYVKRCAKVRHEPVPYTTYEFEMTKRTAEKVAYEKHVQEMLTTFGSPMQIVMRLDGRYVVRPAPEYKLTEPLGPPVQT